MFGNIGIFQPRAALPTEFPLGNYELNLSVGTSILYDPQNPSGVSGNFSAGFNFEANFGGAPVAYQRVPRDQWANLSYQPAGLQTRNRLHLVAGYTVRGVGWGTEAGSPPLINGLRAGIGWQIARFNGMNPLQIYTQDSRGPTPRDQTLQPVWSSTLRLMGSYFFEGNLPGAISFEYKQQFRLASTRWNFHALAGADLYLRAGLPAAGVHFEAGLGYFF